MYWRVEDLPAFDARSFQSSQTGQSVRMANWNAHGLHYPGLVSDQAIFCPKAHRLYLEVAGRQTDNQAVCQKL